ncbi:MAG: hypothetical protein A3H91_12805 [Gammaproteobacteria bacterium RIFCSPLOWO2_02_FULL_61_13]|nr:MAG: hypothetical protein A3H91_12805 [Gammaproteobacteria bacterium RIFCSPLOWO2_02_FULL_61_13]
MSLWRDAGSADLNPGQARTVEIDGIMVGVVNLKGELLAIEDRCTHDGSPLFGCGLATEDLLDGDQVICPRHGSRFCLRTGAALNPPAYEPASTFAVRVHAGRIQVEFP